MAVLIIISVIVYVIVTLILGGVHLGDYLNEKEFQSLYGDSYKKTARAFLRTPLWPLDALKAVGQVFIDARKL